METYDAIVAGSGITGGWAAKELTERGLKVLMIERGPNLRHRIDYRTEYTPPWELPHHGYLDPVVLATTKRNQRGRVDAWTQDLFVDDEVEVYESPTESSFRWIRGYQLGGRSLMWARNCYRMSETHFAANKLDGHGIDWPVRYADIASWYDYVERFIGVNGTVENIPSLPDGQFQPSMGMNAGERRLAEIIRTHHDDRRVIPSRTANLTQPIGDRMVCQNRTQCARGCSFGAYFSTQSSTLPAAQATGRLSLLTDTIVESLDYDAANKRVTGVRLLDAKTGARSVATAKMVFMCCGSINSVSVLLRSVSEAMPRGLGNSSGLLGSYITDHCYGSPIVATIPGIENQMYRGRKPSNCVMPRFINMDKQETDFHRGYSYAINAARRGWSRGASMPGIGAALKLQLRQPGEWVTRFAPSMECLPRKENAVTVNFNARDRYGLPLTRIDVRWSDNERKGIAHAHVEAVRMLSLLGGTVQSNGPGFDGPPGWAIHEMGGTCMGHDPANSVTNALNQLHDAPNVFVTDGAFMNSCGDRNPSLTYMAFTARAAANAVGMLKQGQL